MLHVCSFYQQKKRKDSFLTCGLSAAADNSHWFSKSGRLKYLLWSLFTVRKLSNLPFKVLRLCLCSLTFRLGSRSSSVCCCLSRCAFFKASFFVVVVVAENTCLLCVKITRRKKTISIMASQSTAGVSSPKELAAFCDYYTSDHLIPAINFRHLKDLNVCIYFSRLKECQK